MNFWRILEWPPYTRDAPSGNGTQAAQRYFHWIWEQYYAQFHTVWQGGKSWTLSYWDSFFFLYMWGFIMAVGFFFLGWYFFREYRHKDDRHPNELYSPVSFNGYITERNGKIDMVWWYAFFWIALASLFYIVTNTVFGQAY